MSLFINLQVVARHYVPVDDDNAKSITSLYDLINSDAEYTEFMINTIKTTSQDEIVFGDTLGDFTANVDYAGIKKGDYIYIADDEIFYEVVSKPKLLRLFNKYKLNLKAVE